MNSSILVAVFASLMVSTTFTQINPYMLGLFGGDMDGMMNPGIWAYSSLSHRLQELEYRVTTGSLGGCESGVIGPLSAAQGTGQLTFRSTFVTPPALSLALSDLKTANPTAPIDYEIRPTMVTTQGATITLTDRTTNIAAAHVAYMACPSSSS